MRRRGCRSTLEVKHQTIRNKNIVLLACFVFLDILNKMDARDLAGQCNALPLRNIEWTRTCGFFRYPQHKFLGDHGKKEHVEVQRPQPQPQSSRLN